MSALTVAVLLLVCLCSYVGCLVGAYRDQPLLSVERAVFLPIGFGTVGFLAHLCLLWQHSLDLSEVLFTLSPLAVGIAGLVCGRICRRTMHPEEFDL
jgi:hypothetical protein